MTTVHGRDDSTGAGAIGFEPSIQKNSSNPVSEANLFLKIDALLQTILKQMANAHTGGAPSEGGRPHSHHSHRSQHAHHAYDPTELKGGSAANGGGKHDSDSASAKGAGGAARNHIPDAKRTSRAISGPATPLSTATSPVSGGTTTGKPGDYSRQTLDAGHGWGAQNGGVSGGSKADPAQVYTVTNRSQLLAALGGNNATNGSNSTPKIIQVEGNINLNADATGKELGKSDFANENAQLAHDMMTVGSNTTIIGMGSDAGITGGGLNVSNSHNVIVRNLNMTTPFDYFPGKDAEGNPHGRVYSIEAKGAQNIWIDHNTFKDGTAPAGAISGDQVDFTDGANYATISNNQFLSHNKSILIGSSDAMTSDAGKLSVTIDHNLFAGVSQRDPRVRFGNVEVANNLYQDSSSQVNRFQYNLGVGVESNVTSQNNAFETQGVSESSLVKRFGTSGHLTDSGSLVNGQSANLSSSPTGNGPGAGAINHLDPTANVASIVLAQSGAGKLGLGD